MASKFLPKRPDNSHLIKHNVKHVWSSFQKEIFKNIARGTGNTLIIARAGSSKTSSLVEGSKYIPRGKSSIFLAFNKSIQEELKARLPSYVFCSTIHSAGFKAVKQRFGNVELDNNKCWNIVKDFFSNEKDTYDLINNICKTVNLSKLTLSDTPASIEEIVIKYDIDLCDIELEQFIHYVSQTLRKCKEQTNVIDFTDMVWFPFVYNIKIENYEYVFLDEAHDNSKLLIELALSMVKKPNGRIIAVLDNFQAIYGFAGADEFVLDNFRKRLNPTELSLPICYRCPKKVVSLAQTLVEDIQAYENAIEGEIINIETSELIKTAKPGDYVISRYNAPLVKHCLKFLRAGIPANMLGRDIGDNLLYLIKKSKKKKVSDFLKWMDNWGKEEKERLLSKYPKASTDTISDKVECMYSLCDGANSIEDVKKNIGELFQDGDEKKIVLFSSIHKIKGKEQDNVFVLADTLKGHNQQEINCKYVSFTRAKKKLYLVYNKLPDPELEK